MELCLHSTLSSFPPNSNQLFNFSKRRKNYRNPNHVSFQPQISLKSDQISNDYYLYPQCKDVEWREDNNFVQVIGIGSRKDAILDFCLDSPFQSSFSSIRFWNIISSDSSPVKLQQRTIGEDAMMSMELQEFQLSAPRTVILVASAGYGSDHITAIELLKAVKSAEGLAVGIVLKPFSFEGRRRQEEVTELVTKLREHTNCCIVVDTDVLLKKEVVTLAEALKSANNVVLLSINSIFVLMSAKQKKLFECPQNIKKEFGVPELLTLLESSEEARVGYGAGNNMKSSIVRAVFDCPFIAGGLKELNGVVFWTLACAVVIDNSNFHTFLHTFRQATGWQNELVLSIVHEPNLEPNLFVSTVIVCGGLREKVSQTNGILSGLAQRFPFVLSLFGRDRPESKEPLPDHLIESPHAVEHTSSMSTEAMVNLNSLDDNSSSPNRYLDKLQSPSGRKYVQSPAFRYTEHERTKVEISSASDNLLPDDYNQISQDEPPFDREPLIWWNGPSFDVAEEWAKERAAISGSNTVLGNQCTYTLPVGVKPSERSMETPEFTNMQSLKSRISNDMNGKTPGSPNVPSWDALTDAGVEAVMDIYNATSTILKGKNSYTSKKPGLLSTRAASMLESERDSQKKWAPIIQMQYRGGSYRGRCQGGLPEGKGRLTLVDGSIYDGVWRYGKKSGVGTFYYSNGDVFQGSWRDDLIHGKGWFYFRSGDRWFANFWKGKANGEGRFYSKNGEIFFGHFEDGWRHGHSLCISADGVR
ncbi:hypothetical protein IFM89_007794 [Coptis chinensis]|uniref:Protein ACCUMULATION AND REPLICATION OF CHLOROPLASTS 3 n=1 Tax=Coptis chinensis TaxID=261450 RepID=A0A835IV04_9MAGN|nr:hypothetical protein IFM89_007794 [Coptis chinensis]